MLWVGLPIVVTATMFFSTLYVTSAAKKVPRVPLLSAADVYEKLTGTDGDGAASVTLGPLPTQHGTGVHPDVHLVKVDDACGAQQCASVALACPDHSEDDAEDDDEEEDRLRVRVRGDVVGGMRRHGPGAEGGWQGRDGCLHDHIRNVRGRGGGRRSPRSTPPPS